MVRATTPHIVGILLDLVLMPLDQVPSMGILQLFNRPRHELSLSLDTDSPNIVGTIPIDRNVRVSGAFAWAGGAEGASGTGSCGYVNFNASKSSNIYGKSSTVQPASTRILFVIKY